MNYEIDRDFTDTINKSNRFKKALKKFTEFEQINGLKCASDKLDKDNSIDYHIILNNGTEIACQGRWQRFSKIDRGQTYKSYGPTLRYSRHKSKTEFNKIIDNKNLGNPYPKYLLWGIYDEKNNKIMRLEIINLESFCNDITKNKKYYITGYNEMKYGMYELHVMNNKDESSKFLILNGVPSIYSYDINQ